MDDSNLNDPTLNPRQAALAHTSPENVAVVAALVYVGDMLASVQETLATLDVTVNNGLVAIAED